MASQKNTRTLLFSAIALVVIAAAAWLFFSSKNSPEPLAGADLIDGETLEEGVHYRTLQSPIANSESKTPDSKISVLEFFWYGCPHCQSFEPKVRDWLKTAPDDVEFNQMPVAWNDATRLHAAVFYVADKAEDPDALHDKLFESIIGLRQERNLSNQLQKIAAEFSGHGVEESQVQQKVAAPQVKADVTRAEKIMRQAEVSSTPTVVVDGRWAILNNDVVGKLGTFTVVDLLIAKARTE